MQQAKWVGLWLRQLNAPQEKQVLAPLQTSYKMLGKSSKVKFCLVAPNCVCLLSNLRYLWPVIRERGGALSTASEVNGRYGCSAVAC